MATFRLKDLFKEARRRRLFGVLALYIIGAWVVLQVAATLFPGWRISEEAIRFVWIGAVILFPAALLFGWWYDVSAQGIRRTPPAGKGDSGLLLVRTDYWVLSLFALFIGGVCFGVISEVLDLREAPQPEVVAKEIPPNSIAVLPFVNMSDDESNEYFSDGITEQLLNELARVPDLHVAARTSAFYYKDKSEMMDKIGQELGVRTLLEGSVRKAGNNVRITAQLINASDGFHLWSDTYDRQLDDIFALQDEIAMAIVNTLRIELMVQDQERFDRSITSNVEAFDLFLRGMANRRIYADDSVDKSNELFQQAIDIDPGFAHAHDALAYGYLLKTYNGSLSIDDATAQAAVLLEKALDLRPDLEEAHASMGLLKTRLQRYDEANEHYETALAINANYFGGHVNYGLSLVLQSRLKEASAAYIRAQALDPMNGNLNFNLGALMMLMGEFDNGYEFIQKSLAINPDLYGPKGAITHWLAIYGRLDEAVLHGQDILAAHPDHALNIAALIHAYVFLGLIDEAENLIADARESMPDNDSIRNAEITFMLSTGDNESFIKLAEEEFRALDVNVGDSLNVRDRERAFRYAWSSLIRGENEQAADFFYWVAGEEDGIASKTYDEMHVLKMLALAYRRLDRIEESDALLKQCLELVQGARERGWATPSLHVRLAEIYALGGDVQNAIANLEIAFDKGWRDLSTIEYGIFWQNLQDDPELNRIKVMIYDDLEVQRQRFREKSFGTENVTARL